MFQGERDRCADFNFLVRGLTLKRACERQFLPQVAKDVFGKNANLLKMCEETWQILSSLTSDTTGTFNFKEKGENDANRYTYSEEPDPK